MNSNKLLVVSNYNSNCEWIKQYNYNYVVFDRSDSDEFIFDKEKTIKVPNIGHNIYDYFMYFYNYYDSLPEYSCLLKGNMFLPAPEGWQEYKYITKEKFDKVIHNNCYTFLTSWGHHSGFIHLLGGDGSLLERNDPQHMINVQHSFYPPLAQKYFLTYNQFLAFIYKEPIFPVYIQFSPGACYIVPKGHVLKYPRAFWYNLTNFINYNNNPLESHFLERMMHTLFTCEFEIQDHMKTEFTV